MRWFVLFLLLCVWVAPADAAEFLIYNTDHWTKKLSAEDKAKWTRHEQLKFAAVHEKGDIVEVRPDGYWTTRKYRTDVFRVVKKPGLDYKKYLHLMKAVENDTPDSITGKTYLQLRRKGKIDALDNIVDKVAR